MLGSLARGRIAFSRVLLEDCFSHHLQQSCAGHCARMQSWSLFRPLVPRCVPLPDDQAEALFLVGSLRSPNWDICLSCAARDEAGRRTEELGTN